MSLRIIRRRLTAVYGAKPVDTSTVNSWLSRFRKSESGTADVSNRLQSGRPVIVTKQHLNKMDQLKFKPIPYSPCTPDLPSCNFYFSQP